MLNDFLLWFSFFITSTCLAISCRLLFIRRTPIHLKLFPVYLLVSLVAEIIGFKVQYENGNNHVIFNFYIVVSFTFYLFVVWKILDKGRCKSIALYSFLFFPVVAFINMAYLQSVYYYNTYTHSLGAVLIVLLSINSLYQLFLKTPTKISPTQLPDFWICMGLLVFYGVTFVGFNAIQAGISHSVAAMQIISIILSLSQYFLYINFSIGFFCALNQPPTNKNLPDNQETFSP